MAFAKKTWKDRIAEFPTRRRLTKEDNTSELVTVAREEGTLSQEGDAFSAENMNDLENRIDAEFTEVNGKLQTANLYLGDIIKVSANVTTIGWHNNDINIPTAAKIDGYEFVEYILSADTYRISGISHSGSSITYYVNTVGTSANINCIPLYKRL